MEPKTSETKLPSFLVATTSRSRKVVAQTVLDTVRDLCRIQKSSSTLYLDEDSFLALEFWHHRFCGWDWNALRRLDYTGGATLDFGYGPVEVVVVPTRGKLTSYLIELGGLRERDQALLTYISG